MGVQKIKGYGVSKFADHIGQALAETLSQAFFPKIEQVIFNPPRTIVNWSDGTKTIVKVMEGDEFDEHVGFQAAVTRKVFGGHSQYKRLIENAVRTSSKVTVLANARTGWRVIGDDEVMIVGDKYVYNTDNHLSSYEAFVASNVGKKVSDLDKDDWDNLKHVIRKVKE